MLILLIVAPLWAWQNLGDMVGRCMSNSGHGGCPGICFMTIVGSYVGPHFPNIAYFEVYEGI